MTKYVRKFKCPDCECEELMTSTNRNYRYCRKCGLIISELTYYDDVDYNEHGVSQREFITHPVYKHYQTKPLNRWETRKILGHDFGGGLFRRRKKR